MAVIASESQNLDWSDLVAGLNQFLRLRTTPIGMKLFEHASDIDEIERIRRPKHIHTTDQIVGQASRNGWTVGITAQDLVGAQCQTVIGLAPRSEEWLSGKNMAGVLVRKPRRVCQASSRDGRRTLRQIRSDGC